MLCCDNEAPGTEARVRLEQVVGQRIHDIRERAGMSQAGLGRALAPLLGRPWTRQAVSAAEKGARDFKIAELVAIARVLETTVAQLVLPGPEVRREVVFPSGKTITAMELLDAVLSPRIDMESERGQVLKTGNELAEAVAELRLKVIEADEAGAESFRTLARLLRQVQGLARITPETSSTDNGEES
jgi:transcriptional regulator with XRE-family HTH domain